MARRSPLLSSVGSVACAVAMVAIALVGAAAPAQAAVGDVTPFGVTAGSKPRDVAAGPDGNLWATGFGGGAVFRVTPSGAVTSFATPTPGGTPFSIAAGPDGNLWFTMILANKVAKITPAGLITEYNLPNAGSQPAGIVAGPDGAMWFTELIGNRIGRITMDGVITEYPLPTAAASPMEITAGPEGSNRLYFTEVSKNKIGYITTAGAVTETVSLPAGSAPYGIATIGGSVWFVETGKSNLAHLVNDTTVARIAVGVATSPVGIAAGPGGSIWVTATTTSQVWRFDGQGATLGQYTLPTPGSSPFGITMGPDGNMWVAASEASTVDRVVSGQVPTLATAPAVAPVAGVVPGTILNPTNGTWNYQPTTYAYQWQRCPTAGAASCADIAGATWTAYTATADDNLRYVRVGVTAGNLSGTSTVAYSPLIGVGTSTPPEATGPIASIGNGATAQLVSPSTQRRGRTRNYAVLFSVTDVQGTVTLTFKRGSKTKTVAGLNVSGGSVQYKWKAPKKWPKGTTSVTATYLPAPGTPYSAGAMVDTVRVK